MDTPKLTLDILPEELSVSTYDTDYILVRNTQLDIAVAALEASGCGVS